MLEWALYYISIGWYVFPLNTSGDVKAPHPMTTEGREKDQGGHNAASIDPAVICDWWKRSPNSGIGVHCGRSGLVLVDVDPRNGGDKTIVRLRQEHPGVFVSSVEAATGGGGSHSFFVAEKGARYPGNLGPVSGIDVKLNGYVVLAPSPHPSGGAYRWVDGKTPDDGEVLMKRLPAPLMNEIRERARNGNGKARKVRQDDTIEADEDDIFAEYDDRPLEHTVEQIRKIVFSIPNEGHRETDPEDYVKSGGRSYDDWFEVVCGIYHQTNGSEEGKQLCLEWSQQMANHIESEFEKKWASAGHENKGFRPKTFRSVIAMANTATKEERQAKYETILDGMIQAADLDELLALGVQGSSLVLANPLLRKNLESQMLVASKRIAGAVVLTKAEARKALAYRDPLITNAPEWCANVCFISGENVFLDWRDARNSWTKQAFDSTFMRAAMSEEDIRVGASRPTHAPSDLALTRYGVPVVDARGYLPSDKSEDPFYTMDGRRYVNTYTGAFAVKAKPSKSFNFDDEVAVGVFEEYGSIVYPVTGEWWMLKTWFQYPVKEKKRVGWSPLLYSVEGMGKTLLFNLIRAMIGANNASVITGMNLHEKFNSWAEGKLIAFAEEVGGFDKKERFDTLNALKPFITNPVVTIRRMGVDPYDTANSVNIIMSTNKREAFDLSNGDTRLWLPTPGFRTDAELAAFKAARPDFYPEVVDAFTNHAAAIKRHLLNMVPHPDFRPGSRAPASALKRELIEDGKSTEWRLIEDVLRDSNRADLSDTLLRLDVLIEECGETDGTVGMPQDRWLTELLKKMGFAWVARVRVGGRNEPKRSFWSRTPARFAAATPAETARLVLAYLAEQEDDSI